MADQAKRALIGRVKRAVRLADGGRLIKEIPALRIGIGRDALRRRAASQRQRKKHPRVCCGTGILACVGFHSAGSSRIMPTLTLIVRGSGGACHVGSARIVILYSPALERPAWNRNVPGRS